MPCAAPLVRYYYVLHQLGAARAARRTASASQSANHCPPTPYTTNTIVRILTESNARDTLSLERQGQRPALDFGTSRALGSRFIRARDTSRWSEVLCREEH